MVDRRKRTFTKKWMAIVMSVALIDMQMPFVLAMLGREQIAEELGKVIAVEIIGVFLVYCAKSFFETKESEKVRLEEEKRRSEDIEFLDLENDQEGGVCG